MKDEMKKEPQQPVLPLSQLLAGLMGGKGLQEMLDELETEETVPPEQLACANQVMQDLWEFIMDAITSKPKKETATLLAGLNQKVWDRIAEWQVEEGMKVGGSAHVYKYAQAMAMLFEKLAEMSKDQMRKRCNCPSCVAERAERGEIDDESSNNKD